MEQNKQSSPRGRLGLVGNGGASSSNGNGGVSSSSGPLSNGQIGKSPRGFTQHGKSPRKSISEASEAFLQSAKLNMRKNSYTMAADDMNKSASESVLSDEENENIRTGCILLQDALAGRASHGLYSLLKEPAWKRTLFVIQTHDLWQQVIIVSSMIHACLIIWEAPNHRASWIDSTLDSAMVGFVECLCICSYAMDVGMKMLYFGGWRDYVSKEWQRNYVIMIGAFSIDLFLYTLRLSPLRFSRPVRLFVIAGRHRDVRRLASFLPRMATKLGSTFIKPMLASLVFFGSIFVRIYGKLPAEKKLDFGDDDFNNIFSSMRTLFMLATMDNFHPVVGEAFRTSPVSFVVFGVFIVGTGFFLMSVALGVIFDLYIEDHHKTVASEAKKETKSVDKAFDKLDLQKKGHVSWVEFKEMMRHLRPWDTKESHVLRIFKELATEEADGILVIQKKAFSRIGSYLHVSFVKNAQSSRYLDARWVWFEEWWVRIDAMIIVAGWDSTCLPVFLPNLSASFDTVCGLNPWMDMRTFDLSVLVTTVEVQLGSVVVLISCCAVVAKAWLHWQAFEFALSHSWRRLDLLVLLVCGAAHALHSLCLYPDATGRIVDDRTLLCRAPYLQVLDAVAAFRIIRAFVHHAGSRAYMASTMQVVPVLMHIGGLSLAVLYCTSVTVMELLAKKPAILLTDAGVRLNLQCNRPLPNFDCPSSAMLSSFELFVEVDWGDVLHLAVPEDGQAHGLYYNLVSCYFILAYTVLGICLCNLLTTLVVEFHKCLMEEEKEKEEKKKEPKKTLTGTIKRILLVQKLGVGTLSHQYSEEDLVKTPPTRSHPLHPETNSWNRRRRVVHSYMLTCSPPRRS